MKRTLLAIPLAVAALAAGGAPGSAQTGSASRSLNQASYAKAREVLDDAIKAAGGLPALHAVKDVSRKGKGTAYNQGQSPKVDPPYTSRPVDVTSVVDFANKRTSTETATVPQGGVPGKARAVLAGDTGFGWNLVTNLVTPTAPAGMAGLRNALRRDPAALLLTAHARADTLRFLGEDPVEGKPQRVVAFADADGTQMTLYFDVGTKLLTKYETLADNAVLGDAVNEVAFSDYRDVAGVKLPFRVVNRTAGEVIQDMTFSEVVTNAQPAATLFEAPKDAAEGKPAGGPTAVSMRKLGEGLYLAEGSTHNSLVVGFKDHVVVVDAPLSDERSQAVMARIAETMPGKPIKYVVPTHHHYDHSGGLRAYIAGGATVITTAGNKAFVERLAATGHTIRPDTLSRAPRPPVIEVLQGKRVLTDGARTVELIDVGPNPHVQEMIAAYLPQEKVLFQADLVGLPAYGPLPPASPATLELLKKLSQLGVQVTTFVGAHGRDGTFDEISRLVATASK